jgi:GNAT superfamily N-acetyltransferase
MVEIVKFKSEDLSELQSLIHTTIRRCYPSIYAPEVVDFFIGFHSYNEITARSKIALIFTLRDNNEMLATGFLLENELGGVYVHPDYQGLGYGRMIVEHLLKIAKSAGLKFIHLDSTPIAKGMYEKLGFHVTEPAIQMIGDVPLPYFKMGMKLTS